MEVFALFLHWQFNLTLVPKFDVRNADISDFSLTSPAIGETRAEQDSQISRVSGCNYWNVLLFIFPLDAMGGESQRRIELLWPS